MAKGSPSLLRIIGHSANRQTPAAVIRLVLGTHGNRHSLCRGVDDRDKPGHHGL